MFLARIALVVAATAVGRKIQGAIALATARMSKLYLAGQTMSVGKK